MPVERTTTPRQPAAAGASKVSAQRGLARAQTIAVDTTLLSDLDSDLEAGGGDGEEEEDSDLDILPPLSSLTNRLPAGVGATKGKAATRDAQLLSSSPIAAEAEAEAEAATAEATGRDDESHRKARMTKLYVPRKSVPGFFKEIDVSVDEAEVLKAHVAAGGPGGRGQRGRAWRRSDIECIDLTGYD